MSDVSDTAGYVQVTPAVRGVSIGGWVTPFYDPDDGSVVMSRYPDGVVQEALEVRKGLVEATIRDAVIAELERRGYTVTPPTAR